MAEWNEQHLERLVWKMKLRRTPGQKKPTIHLSLYNPGSKPLLAQVMQLDAKEWQALGYDETDQVSIIRYLGSLGCRTDGALSTAIRYQPPLTLELAKLLIDAGCDPTAQNDIGWDALVSLAVGGHPVDPQVTELFLSAGCRTSLDGCGWLLDKHRLRFDQILAKHAQWKENLSRMSTENSQTDTFYGPDWGR